MNHFETLELSQSLAYYTMKKFVFLICVVIITAGCTSTEDTSYITESSESSDDSDSFTEDGVTMTYCKSSESESQSLSSLDDDGKDQCVSAHILRQSGQTTFTGTDAGAHNAVFVTLEVMQLNEVTYTGENIETNGHWYDTFTNKKFQFSKIKNGKYRGLKVKYIMFATTLDNSASLTVQLYIFKEDGIINNGDETIAVHTGTSKINVVISNWPFCGKVTCKQGDNYVLGEYLDLTIAVRGISPAGEEDREENHGSSFGVGSGKIVFSDKAVFASKGYPFKNIFKRYGEEKKVLGMDILMDRRKSFLKFPLSFAAGN